MLPEYIHIKSGILAQFNALAPQCKQPLIVARGAVKERYLRNLLLHGKFGSYTICDAFTQNPSLQDAQKQLEAWGPEIEYKCDSIIALGGGSPLDFAKTLKYNSTALANKPFIAVVTTLGSGSEITPFAVVYDNGVKVSLSAPNLKPEVVIVDPRFAASSSSQQRASSGIDCLCQGIEAFWSKRATEQSTEYALECIKLCVANLKAAVYLRSEDDVEAQKSNERALTALAQASAYSGLAISQSKTTAAHALSYFFTARFGLKHGQAVALIMRDLFALNCSVTPHKEQLLDALGLKDVSDFAPWFRGLLRDLGLKDSFADLQLSEEDIKEALATVNSERLANNPYQLSEAEMRSLLN